ncbi:MAG: phosphoglucosamine mutase [Bacteroidota bacterium]
MSLIKSISGTRGTIGGKPGENLTPIDIVQFSAAYGTRLKASDQPHKVVIGRDARISGQLVQDLVINTLVALGIDIIDLGLSTTPTVAMAVPNEAAGGGIIVTASHNPKQWNALKFLNEKGEFISAKAGKEILKIAAKNEMEFATIDQLGSITKKDDYINWHIEEILKLPLVKAESVKAKNFKVVVDCINSTGALSIPPLLEKLGCDVFLINEEVNGRFAHNPEPLPENLNDLSRAVTFHNAHLGIAVDPDVDRLALVSEDGEMFGEEYTLVAIADYVLQNQPGNTVSNLSSTRGLKLVTEKHGQQYTAAAVGEVNVVKAMKKTKAVIGGEGNGGVIYPDLHYGRDALVGIALFLSHLAEYGKSVSFLRKTYPSDVISKNKIQLTPEIDLDNVLEKLSTKYNQQPQNTIDGLKIEFDEDWIHLRKSNTEPIIRIYAESHSEVMAQNLANKIQADISDLIKGN